jgi:hypothetical protein
MTLQPCPSSADDLLQRKGLLKAKLIVSDEGTAFNHSVYRKECHWDFVLKEVVSSSFGPQFEEHFPKNTVLFLLKVLAS